MKYSQTITGIFEDRPNRFIAHVWVDGILETVHVKNTGRCKELLIKGVKVVLYVSDNKERKTKYDLIAVYKEGLGLVNIDSQAPNKVVREWLDTMDCDFIKPEYTYGKSRIDFYIEKNGHRILLEVKGCTLEKDRVGYFPDAPTERGVKHLLELKDAIGNMDDKRALELGLSSPLESVVAFVIQMEHIDEVRAEKDIHKDFYDAMELAKKSGVRIMFLGCYVSQDGLYINRVLGDSLIK